MVVLFFDLDSIKPRRETARSTCHSGGEKEIRSQQTESPALDGRFHELVSDPKKVKTCSSRREEAQLYVAEFTSEKIEPPHVGCYINDDIGHSATKLVVSWHSRERRFSFLLSHVLRAQHFPE